MSLPRQNRVARFYDAEDLRLETEPVPLPGPGEALVRTRVCGICSGDLMDWYLRQKAPLVFGHEVVGEVEAVGHGVKAFRPGDRVFVHHHAPCLECRACGRGDYVQCVQWRASRLIPGGMAEFFLVPRGNLDRDTLGLPDTLDFESAALIEPTACVIKSLRRAALRGGERMLIIGLGIMGQLHVALAHRFGVGEVIGADLEPWRCEQALALGADRVIDASQNEIAGALRDMTSGEMAEVVVVGPGTLEAIETGLRAVAPGGKLVLFTATRPEERLAISVYDLYFREVSLIPTYSCGPIETREALQRIVDGEIPCERLITHRFPLEEIEQAYREASHLRGSLKTLIVFGTK